MSAAAPIASAAAERAAKLQRYAFWAALGTIVVWGANFSIQKASR